MSAKSCGFDCASISIIESCRGSICGLKASLSSSREAHWEVSLLRNSAESDRSAGKELRTQKVLVKSAPKK